MEVKLGVGRKEVNSKVEDKLKDEWSWINLNQLNVINCYQLSTNQRNQIMTRKLSQIPAKSQRAISPKSPRGAVR